MVVIVQVQIFNVVQLQIFRSTTSGMVCSLWLLILKSLSCLVLCRLSSKIAFLLIVIRGHFLWIKQILPPQWLKFRQTGPFVQFSCLKYTGLAILVKIRRFYPVSFLTMFAN